MKRQSTTDCRNLPASVRPHRVQATPVKYASVLLVLCSGLGIASPATVAVAQTSKRQARRSVDFNEEVRPILARHCFKCHGPDDKARKARLRLDRAEEALKPASSGERPIVPGKPDESELVRRIFAEEPDERMPPPAANVPLTESARQTL